MTTLKTIARSVVLGLATSAFALTAAAAEELTFVSWMKDEPGYGDWWNEVIARFEAEHPGTTVEMSKVGRDEYSDTMFTMFAGGTPPDIVHLAAFEFQPFADEGWLEPLDPWIERAGIDLEGWAGQSTCTWEGETYCVMLLYTAFILAYNEALLAEAGVAVPTDWESFLAAAKAATRDTDGDGITDVYGVGVSTTGGTNMMHDMLSFVLDAGGAWTVDGAPTFDRPETIEGLRRYKELYDARLTPRDVDTGGLRQLLTEGRVAMRVDGPWIYNIMQGAEPGIADDLKLAPSPFDPPVGGTSNVIAMPADISDDKKELVFAFIQTAISPEMQQRFAALGSSPAPMPGLDYSAQIAADPNFELFVQENERASSAGIDRLPEGLELQFNEVAKVVFREVQRMLTEDLPAEEAGGNIQAAVEQISR